MQVGEQAPGHPREDAGTKTHLTVDGLGHPAPTVASHDQMSEPIFASACSEVTHRQLAVVPVTLDASRTRYRSDGRPMAPTQPASKNR